MLLETSKQYFAKRPKSEFGKFLVEKLQKSKQLASSGMGVREEELNAYRHYYGKELGNGITTGVQRDGEQGELAAVRINKARSYAKAQLALVTSAKFTWRPTARNTDSGAVKATLTAQHLLEDAWKTGGLQQVVLRWAEQAIAFAQGFVFSEWDPMKGKLVYGQNPTPEMPMGRVIKEGDITRHNVLPWDVLKDEMRRSSDNLSWRAVRLQKNRWDLAAVYPRLADGKPSYEAILNARDPLTEGGDQDDDTAVAYYFFHEPSPSLPAGRETLLLADNCVLYDRPLTYDNVPLYRLAADEMYDSPNGWSQFWDVLGVQEVKDAIDTSIATNLTSLGTQIVAMEKGTSDSGDTVSGMRMLKYPKGGKPPEGINLHKPAEGAMDYLAKLDGDQREMLGLNDVALGQPETAQMNAEAFALLASMAVQNAGPFQTALLDAVSRLGTGDLKTITKRVSKPRKLQITGTTSKNLYTEQEYSGADLKPVDRVIVSIGGALEQTPAGRAMLLQRYGQISGAITTVEDVQQVIDTGRLEPATRAARDERLLITSEYEALSQGQVPPVHTYQNHPLHYRENAAVLLNPEALNQPEVIKAVQDHCDAHYREYFGLPDGAPVQSDPLYLDRIRILLGQPVPGAAGGMMDPAAGGGVPPGGSPPPAAPPEGEAPPPELTSPQPGEGMSADTQPPENPLTGAQVPPGVVSA